MKTFSYSFRSIICILLSILISGIIGCENDDPGTKTKTPLWVYKANGPTAQSKPYVVGDSVIICSRLDDVFPHLPNVYSLNRNNGNLYWKSVDTLAYYAVSPVVYKNQILLGGLNPHSLNLHNGNPLWAYVDPDYYPLKHSVYNNPLLVGDAVYFVGMFGVSKHSALSGGRVWKTENGELWSNLRFSRLVFKNAKLYFGDAGLFTITSFFESTGRIEWFKTFESAFTNIPAVTDNEIFIGIQDANINNKTLRCLKLADQTEKWAVKLGSIISDVVVAGDKVYAIGMTTIHCRSAIDGTAIWHYEMSAGADSEPMVAGNKVFVGYGNGLLCLNATTGELLWEYETAGGGDGHGFGSPTLDGDRFYVGCWDNNVYCFSVE